ncbi:MAG: hypothetical protein U1E17_01630 [Geminicoccaceae bacterium]
MRARPFQPAQDRPPAGADGAAARDGAAATPQVASASARATAPVERQPDARVRGIEQEVDPGRPVDHGARLRQVGEPAALAREPVGEPCELLAVAAQIVVPQPWPVGERSDVVVADLAAEFGVEQERVAGRQAAPQERRQPLPLGRLGQLEQAPGTGGTGQRQAMAVQDGGKLGRAHLEGSTAYRVRAQGAHPAELVAAIASGAGTEAQRPSQRSWPEGRGCWGGGDWPPAGGPVLVVADGPRRS